MTARNAAAKSAPAKAAAAKIAAPPATTAPASAPAVAPVKATAPTVDLAKLAARASAVEEMPKVARDGGSTNAFVGLVKASFEDKKARKIGPIPVADTATVRKLVTSIRNAAGIARLGVSIREINDEEAKEVSVYFQAKELRATASK